MLEILTLLDGGRRTTITLKNTEDNKDNAIYLSTYFFQKIYQFFNKLNMQNIGSRMKMKISAAVSSLSVRQFFIEASASVVLE